jgi:hypothetical protein
MRWWRMAIVALLVVVGAGLAPGRVSGEMAAIGVWAPAAAPPEGVGTDRADLTVLNDGRVLLTRLVVADRPEQRRVAAALYLPAADRWEAVPAPEPQGGYNAPVLLRNGWVLVSGGATAGDYAPDGGGFVTASAQKYDPAAQRWEPVAALAQARAHHTASLLQDGTVIVVGGQAGTRYGERDGLASAERFDPQTGKWSTTGALAGPRTGHTATLLRDGRVLVVGGQQDDRGVSPDRNILTAELYDPATGQ